MNRLKTWQAALLALAAVAAAVLVILKTLGVGQPKAGVPPPMRAGDTVPGMPSPPR